MLELFHSDRFFEAGADEAGRGCLAGPVTCASVMISPTAVKPEQHSLLWKTMNDSKKLSEKTRILLQPFIENQAIDFKVIQISETTIDQINILNASILGMQMAIAQLSTTPKHAIVDGNRFNSGLHLPAQFRTQFVKTSNDNKEVESLEDYCQIPYTTIIKGDSKYLSIAAASILAKTYRDSYMLKIHDEFPVYNWAQNKGYPTKDHIAAIAKYGRCKYHRFSFKDFSQPNLHR